MSLQIIKPEAGSRKMWKSFAELCELRRMPEAPSPIKLQARRNEVKRVLNAKKKAQIA
jgi:hypothetical protein